MIIVIVKLQTRFWQSRLKYDPFKCKTTTCWVVEVLGTTQKFDTYDKSLVLFVTYNELCHIFIKTTTSTSYLSEQRAVTQSEIRTVIYKNMYNVIFNKSCFWMGNKVHIFAINKKTNWRTFWSQ